MPMHSLAKIEDFEARFGPVADADKEIIETLLDDASALILSAVEGSEAEWVTDEKAEVPRQVVFVCVSMANRSWQRGEGIASERLGEYGITYRRDSPYELWLTKDERRVIRKAAELSSAQEITLVSPYSGDDEESEMDFDLEGS